MAYPGYYPTLPESGGDGHGYMDHRMKYDGGYGYPMKNERFETRSVDRLNDRKDRRYMYGKDQSDFPPPYQTPGPVVTSQPMRMSGPNLPKRQWSTGLCDCTRDMKTCLCMWCCGECYACYLIDAEFGEHCCNAWPCFLGGPLSFLALRYKIRNELNIEGSLMEDCLVISCCYLCAVCQLKREKDIIKQAGDTRVGERNVNYVAQRRAAEMYMQRY